MKTTALMLLLLFSASLLPAQTDATAKQPKVRPQVLFGALFVASGTSSFPKTWQWKNLENPFVLGYNFCPNILLITSKTYHNFMYRVNDNSLRLINGYWLKKDLGMYLALMKSLNLPVKYVGVGIEKKIEAGKVNFFLFTELGIITNPDKGLLTIGFHANIETPFRKRKN